MTAKQLREKYLNFFKQRLHREIPNASLVPENDPSALFISAGMHPLVPYLLGEGHPLGRRLVNFQRCLRTGDLEKVGDTFHHTFFEMLGNWSLGDYFKKEMIPWALTFLMEELGFKKEKLSVTIFKGDADAPYDQEAENLWRQLGLPRQRIFPLAKEDNWWGPVGEAGPCGPDTEIFYDTGRPACGQDCRPGCGCGKYFELWNLVFMQYEKTKDGQYQPLVQKNVDTGMGVERTTAILQAKDDDYQIELLAPIIRVIEDLSGQAYLGHEEAMRIITDHWRAATFVIADGVIPANKERGYILRRLIRRAVFKMHQLPINCPTIEAGQKIYQKIIDLYSQIYPHLKTSLDVGRVMSEEIERFEKTLNLGVKFLEKYPRLDGKIAFNALQTYGIPFDITAEIAAQRRQKIEKEEFDQAFKEHQEVSRTASRGMFKGGMADHSRTVTKLHTTTHLLHSALREVLGTHVEQVGSNITQERLRFDFTHQKPLTEKELKKIESLVNDSIKKNLPIKWETMSLAEAKKAGALAFFDQKYPEKVKVYTIGAVSKEVCAGPHVTSTGLIGSVRIVNEESAGAGKRRLYGVIKDKIPWN